METKELWFEVSQGKNLVRPHINKKAKHPGAGLNPSYAGGIGRRFMVQKSLEKKTRSYLKNNKAERVWIIV
jgi:hypothetical protein